MEQLRITDTPAGPISYLLTRKRVKNLNLRVRNGQVSLSIPLGCPAEEADAMVRAKCRWIIQALERQWAPGPELPPEPARRECLRLLGEALDRVYPLVQPLGVAWPEDREGSMFQRSSFNYTLAVYDSAAATLSYLEFDT